MFMFFDADDLQDTRVVINDIEKQPYFTKYRWSIRELGHFPENEEISVRIYAMQDEITLNGYEFYYENKQAVADWYKAATEDKTQLEKIKSSHLKGSVNAGSDKMLVFSFPYEDAWRVYIDGVRAVNREAAEGLLAVDISKGTHEIELRYIPKGFILGMPLSIFFLIVFAILCVKNRKTNKS